MSGWSVVPNGDTSAWKPVQQSPSIPGLNPGEQPPAITQPKATLQPEGIVRPLAQGALDFGKGALKGVGNTIRGLGNLEGKIPGLKSMMPGDVQDYLGPEGEKINTPSNTTQAVGKGVEQIGEFLLPGGAEERGAAKLAELAPKLGKVAEPLARIGTSAVSSGLVNKAQGGDFSTGAALGAGGQIVGQGLKAAAPALAESALGITKAMRGNGRDIGQAVLDETKGVVRPSSVAESAKNKISSLYGERQNLLNQASERPNPVRGLLPATLPNASASLRPARDVLFDAMSHARGIEAPTLHGQVSNMSDFLHTGAVSGEPIPENLTPARLGRLQEGFSDEHLTWNPNTHEMANAAGKGAYGAMTGELGRVAPETVPLNRRISNLIPAQRAAESTSRGAGTTSRVLGRFGAHTGALTLGGIGAAGGYKEGGLPGAVAGGVTGVLAPELIASPEGQMAIARSLNIAGGLKPAVGMAAQFTKRKDQQ